MFGTADIEGLMSEEVVDKRGLNQLVDYIFELYDPNETGEISMLDVENMLRDTYKIMQLSFVPSHKDAQGFFDVLNIDSEKKLTKQSVRHFIEKYLLNFLEGGKSSLLDSSYQSQQAYGSAMARSPVHEQKQMAGQQFAEEHPLKQGGRQDEALKQIMEEQSEFDKNPFEESNEEEEEDKELQLIESMILKQEAEERQQVQAEHVPQPDGKQSGNQKMAFEKPETRNQFKISNDVNYVNVRLSMSTRYLKSELSHDNYIAKSKIIEFVQKEQMKANGTKLEPEEIEKIIRLNNIQVVNDKVYFPEFKEIIRRNLIVNASPNFVNQQVVSQKKKE